MIPIYEPGTRLSARIDPAAAADVAEGRFVAVTEMWQDDGPQLSDTKAGGVNFTVDVCPAAEKPLGVTQSGGAPGDHDTIICAPIVVEMTATAAFEAGMYVKAGADGKAAPEAARGVPTALSAGYALSSSGGADAKVFIKLI